MRDFLAIAVRLPIRSLCLVSRNACLWTAAESLARDLECHASLFETVPMDPGKIGLHLRCKLRDVQYIRSVDWDGSFSSESIRVAHGERLCFRVSYQGQDVAVLERPDRELEVSRLTQAERSLLLDLRSLVRLQFDRRNRGR
jgi:hypothetical protein